MFPQFTQDYSYSAQMYNPALDFGYYPSPMYIPEKGFDLDNYLLNVDLSNFDLENAELSNFDFSLPAGPVPAPQQPSPAASPLVATLSNPEPISLLNTPVQETFEKTAEGAVEETVEPTVEENVENTFQNIFEDVFGEPVEEMAKKTEEEEMQEAREVDGLFWNQSAIDAMLFEESMKEWDRLVCF